MNCGSYDFEPEFYGSSLEKAKEYIELQFKSRKKKPEFKEVNDKYYSIPIDYDTKYGILIQELDKNPHEN